MVGLYLYAMNSILFAGPDASLGSLIAGEAANIGLRPTVCANEQESMTILTGTDGIALLVVSSQLADGSALALIRSTRMLPQRATVPIAFIMDNRDLGVAQGALRAGATEIFLRSDDAPLLSFVRECASPAESELLTGRVLLAEDCDIQSMIVSDLCKSLGLAVDRCSTVEEGLSFLQRNEYQAIIIDVVLLGMQSGLSLLRHVRQLDTTHCNIPVLVVSGFDDRARRIEAFRCGADDFLTKPFFSEEFVWRLRRIIQSSEEVSQFSGGELTRPAVTEWQQRGLSGRESEVCDQILLGRSDKEIASELGIAFWTVRTHVRGIFTKLGLINRRELMARYRSVLNNA